MIVDFYISSLSSGGAEKVLITIAEALAADSLNVVSITSLEKRPQFYAIDEKKIKVKRISNRCGGIKEIVQDFIDVKNQLKGQKEGVAISFLSRCNLLLLLASLFYRRKIIVCDRNNPLREHSTLVFFISCLLYSRASAIVVQTNQIKSFYPHFLQKKIYVIENPIDDRKLRNQIQERKITYKRVISMGRLEQQKDFETLIRAFSKVTTNHKDWILDIYGIGKKAQSLNQLICQLKMNDNIHLCGRTNRPVEEMSKSDIFVLSSKYEGFPNVLCEAMYAGCACISTDCVSGPRELIIQGINGQLVPIGDITAMSTAIEQYIVDDRARMNAGENAKSTVKRLYLNQIMIRWKQLINYIGKE